MDDNGLAALEPDLALAVSADFQMEEKERRVCSNEGDTDRAWRRQTRIMGAVGPLP